jgi:hypothetical protein
MDSGTKGSPNIDKKNIDKKINDYFENASYNELYNNDIWFTIIVFIIVILIVLYFYIKSSLVAYRNSWENYKCNPIMMPFASVINSDKVYNNNDLEYILNNFHECLNILNEEVAVDTTKPINTILGYIESVFRVLHTAFIAVKAFIGYLFKLIMYFKDLILNSVKSTLIQIKLFFMNINDFLGKMISFFFVIYYTIILLIRSFKMMFAVLVLGFSLSIVVPISVITVLLLTIVIITIIINATTSWIPIVGWTIAAICILMIILLGGAFIVSVVFLVIALFIYSVFSEFVQTILKQ